MRALRNATDAAHKRVDHIYSMANLSCRADYANFLRAQAAAYLPVEQALERAGAARLLSDWEDRKRAELLRADLLALGASVPDPIATPVYRSPAEMWGGLYVLEGSRLGGALLSRSIGRGLPMSFLNATARPGAWRKLLEDIRSALDQGAAVTAATASAQNAFNLFERAGTLFLVIDNP